MHVIMYLTIISIITNLFELCIFLLQISVHKTTELIFCLQERHCLSTFDCVDAIKQSIEYQGTLCYVFVFASF